MSKRVSQPELSHYVEDRPMRGEVQHWQHKLEDSEWFDDLMNDIFGPRKGGARIIIDAQDARTGVGKTGLAVWLARYLSEVFGYDLEPNDFTLSAAEYLDRWQDHPGGSQPSCIVFDEAAGAGGGHARRAMSNQNVELGNVWQMMRTKRVVSLVTVPHWSRVDKSMRMQADYRLWCLRKPLGMVVPYTVGSGFDKGGTKTYSYDSVDRIQFPNMDRLGDPAYQYLTDQKDELLESQYLDADKLTEEASQQRKDPDEVIREKSKTIAQELRDDGYTVREVADMIDYGRTWVTNNTTAGRATDGGQK